MNLPMKNRVTAVGGHWRFLTGAATQSYDQERNKGMYVRTVEHKAATFAYRYRARLTCLITPRVARPRGQILRPIRFAGCSHFHFACEVGTISVLNFCSQKSKFSSQFSEHTSFLCRHFHWRSSTCVGSRKFDLLEVDKNEEKDILPFSVIKI